MYSLKVLYSNNFKKGLKMEQSTEILFSQKEVSEISKYAEKIYNLVVVLDYFCSNQQEIEELYNITTVLQVLRHNAELLNSHFCQQKIIGA